LNAIVVAMRAQEGTGDVTCKSSVQLRAAADTCECFSIKLDLDV
jgi:hypothetical protein